MPSPVRNIAARVRRFESAWRELAADQEFGGLSLEQFTTLTAPVPRLRDEIDDLRNVLSAKMRERRIEENKARDAMILVINGVRSRPDFGENSPLYRALGYVPKDERGSGLTRKSKEPAPDKVVPLGDAA